MNAHSSKNKKSWLKRRWFEFRMGHNTYLGFVLSFTNFILITYNFFFSQIPVLQTIIFSLWFFVLLFLFLYIPIAIIVGHYHNHGQLETDSAIQVEANPYWKKLFESLDEIKADVEQLKKNGPQ
jgi:hypothetical protein